MTFARSFSGRETWRIRILMPNVELENTPSLNELVISSKIINLRGAVNRQQMFPRKLTRREGDRMSEYVTPQNSSAPRKLQIARSRASVD